MRKMLWLRKGNCKVRSEAEVGEEEEVCKEEEACREREVGSKCHCDEALEERKWEDPEQVVVFAKHAVVRSDMVCRTGEEGEDRLSLRSRSVAPLCPSSLMHRR